MCRAALTETGDAFNVSVSVGTTSIPAEAGSPTDALRIADQRMYSHKTGERASARQQASDLALAALAEHQSTLHEHLTGVAVLARAIGPRMKLDPVTLGNVVRTAELHDVGKLAIADAILNKPGPLDEIELRLMRRHTIIGERSWRRHPPSRTSPGSFAPPTSASTGTAIPTAWPEQTSRSPAASSSSATRLTR